MGELAALAATTIVVVAVLAAAEAHERRVRDRLDTEWTGHHAIRRRMRGLTRRGGSSTRVERAEHGRGWVWIAVDPYQEALGLALTRWGARRNLVFLAKGGDPYYMVCQPRPDRALRSKYNPADPPELEDAR